MKVVTLVDDKGIAYLPTRWEGAGPGGHHREGTLVFNAVNPAPTSVHLQIKEVGGIPERMFIWELK